jgi:adenine phosphoribosyltransferase
MLQTIEESYDLEYGQATLEIHKADISLWKKYLIIDDLIATGETIKVVTTMIEKSDSEVGGYFCNNFASFFGLCRKNRKI